MGTYPPPLLYALATLFLLVAAETAGGRSVCVCPCTNVHWIKAPHPTRPWSSGKKPCWGAEKKQLGATALQAI